MIGVVGATGQVGAAAVRQLAAWGRPVRAGGRDPARLDRVVADAGPGVTGRVVDVGDPHRLADFCAGCQAVVNCAGPSWTVLDRVARAAATAGVPYVDSAGNDPLHRTLLAAGNPPKTAVLSAGMTPGLSGLLPRYLAGAGFDRVRRLTVHHGGRDRFSPAGAFDYLAELRGGTGESGAMWRDGAVVPRALTAEDAARLPFFPEPVTLRPYLSAETVRVGRALGLAEVRWYGVFAGARALSVLDRAGSRPDPAGAAGELVRAAELDLFGHASYQIFLLAADGEVAGAPASRTLLVRGTDAARLTGVMAAVTAVAVAAGECPPGVHHAADVLDPAATVRRLRDSGALAAFAELPGPAAAGPLDVENGEL